MKFCVSLLALMLILTVVLFSVRTQHSIADGMLSHLEECSDDAIRGDMEKLSRDFYSFADHYNKHRSKLSFFLHTDRVEEIDAMIAEIKASVENGEENPDDRDFDAIASSVGRLIDSSERIKEINSLSLSNIF